MVKILHPDYPSNENTLLRLYALDDGGLDCDTAVTAAGIVAGNSWDGFLATRDLSSGDLVRVPRPPDGILRGRAYFFDLPHVAERPYPVTVRFDDWHFPHGRPPPIWREARRDGAFWESEPCRLTGARWAVKQAHVVPSSAQTWWTREWMAR